MTKFEALHDFYNSFDIPAYEENSIPKNAEMPYITYEVITGSFSEYQSGLSFQIWYKSNSWKDINAKTETISKALHKGVKLSCTDGYIMLYASDPFAQNRTDADDKTVKCKYCTISADFITL